jgi:hypothetical protein
MPNFAAAFNSMTGVKKLTTTFPVFKFPARSKLSIRCSVLVCRKNCPVAKCDDASDAGSEFRGVRILEKFFVETTVEVVEMGDPRFDFFSEESAKRVRHLEAATRPDLDAERSASQLHHQTSTLTLDDEPGPKKSHSQVSI